MPTVSFFRRVAIVSFVVDTLLQAVALLEDVERSIFSPSAIYVAYSPHPYAPIAFFSAGVVLQVHWFLRLYSQPPIHDFQHEDSFQSSSINLSTINLETSGGNMEGEEEMEEPNDSTSSSMLQPYNFNTIPRYESERDTIQEPAHLSYLPFYILGTILQGIDATMWLRRRYDYCGALSLVNFAIGAYVLFHILGGSKNRRFPRSNLFTHLVVKIRIAISLLSLWKSWGALDVLPPPGPSEGALTCIFFVALTLSSGPDPTLGVFLAAILASFATGQHTNLGWNLMFGWISVTVLFFALLDLMIGVESRRMICLSDKRNNSHGEALVVSSVPMTV